MHWLTHGLAINPPKSQEAFTGDWALFKVDYSQSIGVLVLQQSSRRQLEKNDSQAAMSYLKTTKVTTGKDLPKPDSRALIEVQ